jgi:ribonuclease P protein component
MLPSVNRMRRSTDFATVVRTGVRARRGSVVVHHAALSSVPSPGCQPAAPIVGLVVGRSVGGSVVRHAVSRKLRAQLSSRILALPAGTGTVVRALPNAATATSAEFGRDLDAALAKIAAVR